jgi:hypothetical protein
MATFTAIKFNPETDPNRPKIGATTVHQGKTYRIEKVDYVTLGEVMKPGYAEPAHDGFDIILFDPDKDRPAVYWIIFGNEVHYDLTHLDNIKTCGECPFWMGYGFSELGECWRPKLKRIVKRCTTDRKCKELKKLKPADLENNIGLTD